MNEGVVSKVGSRSDSKIRRNQKQYVKTCGSVDPHKSEERTVI